MRNSNHAIKFLLAQYRAIFKRAYIKGLASAVLLTAGLAAGQAQAANILDDATKLPLDSGDQVFIVGSTTTGDNKYDAIQITNGTPSFDGTITISGGKPNASGNYFKGSSDLKISGNGTITINTADTTQGLAIIGSGSNTTSLDIGTIDLQQGKLLVTTNKDNGGTVSAAADIVTVGNATTAAQEHTALLTLRANADGETVTFGNENSNITVKGNGRLDLEATSGSITISGAALTLNNGAFMLTTNSGGSANMSGTISVDTYTINSGASHVISGSDSKYVTEIFNGQTANFAGNLLIASGNAWQLDTTVPDEEADQVSGAGVVTLGNGSNTVVGGTITVNSGTLTVAEGAKLHASGTAGVIEVLDTHTSDTSNSVLSISSDNLTRFLTGKDTAGSGSTYTEIKADGTLGEANKATGASGAIVLSGGRLELTDTTAIELNKFSFKAIDSTDGTQGVISFHSGSANTIYAQDLVLKDQLKSGTATISADKNLFLESQTLTLGDSSTKDTTGKDYGFSCATTQNLVLQNSGAAFILKNAVTLDVTVDGDPVVAGESGTIGGDLLISGGASLTAKRGTFSSTDDITISGGTLSVKNGGKFGTGEAAQTIDTILKLEGDLTLQAGVASKIEIDGSNQGEHATILDIQDVNSFKVDSGASTAAEVNIKSGGTLVAKSEHLKTLLTDVTAGQSGAKVFLDQGTISIVDDLTIDNATAKLTSGANINAADDSALTFSSTNGGTLEVDGTLTLNGVGGLDLGAKGTIVAHELRLNNEDQQATDDTAVLKSGKYVAQTALSSHETSDTINISGAQVFLGDFNEIKVEDDDSYHEALSKSGTIDSKVVLSATRSELTVQAGAWKGSSITVKNGTLNVGLDNTVSGFNGIKRDSNGDVIGASLNLATLEVGTNGKSAVAAGSTLDTTTLTVTATAADAFTVAGTANISGKYTAAVTQGQTTTPASYGVTLTGGAGSIQVNQGGVLSFGAEATQAITLDPASDAADKDAIAVAANTFGDKIFSVAAGGTIAFSFSSGDVFSADALTDMRSKLFTDLNSGDGLVAGTINLGDARLAGVTADSDGAYKWDDLQGYSDVADFTTADIKASVVKGIDAGDNIRGHFGALRADSINAGGQITIVGDTSLNNAAAVSGGKFAVGNGGAILGLNVNGNALVQLNGGGAIGAVDLDEGATLSINHDQSITAPALTTIAAIDGGTVQFGVGETEVTGRTEVNNLINNAGSVTFKDRVTVGDASSSSDAETLLGGVATTFEQDATFYNDTEIAGGMTTFQDGVTFNSGAGIYGDTTVSGGAVFGANAEIGGAATLSADSVVLDDTAGTVIRFSVGEEDYVENGQTHSGSTGYLQTASMVLNGNILIIDPSYTRATSIAAIEDFDDVANTDEDAGTFSGTIFVGQNAALGVGQGITVADVQEFIKQYQNSQGALIQDQVGSVLYLDGMLTAADGSQIILDSQHTKTQVFDGSSTTPALINDHSTYWGTFNTETTQRAADLYLGQNTIMAVSDNILSQGAAIHFESDDAAIMAQSVKDSSDAAKIVLDGTGFLDTREVTLFTDAGTDNKGVKILGDQDIRVETLNGVMYFMLRAGEEISGGTLNLDTTKIDTAFLGATDVSRDLLFAYASQTANWDEYFDEANLDKLDNDETKVQREQLHGAAAASHLYTYDPTNSTNRFQLSQVALDAGYQKSDFVVIESTDREGKTTAQVYHRAYNDLLERIVRDTNGAAADGAALQGVFGGAAQAALLAARTSQDAVAGRTGMGATKSALTFADNGQGAGMWVAPIYVSQDSDGFAVSNKDYGVDIDLYGVALGGDYTLSNGLRVGAFFNVGTGDADGNGQAGGVSNDFDYYGVGLYAGYTLGQFSIVGDVSYTVVDSDIDAATQVGTIKSSFDTDNISVGVTGQYEFVLGGAQITPHAGLRYSALSFDDSTFAAGGYDNGGHSELDDVNVFSIPVGVTVAKEFAFDTWTVKPSFDVTLQGNFGDDELDSNAQWDGVAWQSTYTAEFLDNFTYGATLGIAAKTGSFSAGLGLGYTGSENTDEFSATANARFTF